MFEHADQTPDLDASGAARLLEELERSTPEVFRQQRAHFRINVKSSVTLQPGDASQLLKLRLQGVTGDISESGCKCLFPLPVRVGDIYRIEFDRQVINLPLTFARCVRCALVREDAFEAGFLFFATVSLPENLAHLVVQ